MYRDRDFWGGEDIRISDRALRLLYQEESLRTSRNMLSGIADDGEQDQADPFGRDLWMLFSKTVDRVDKELRSDCTDRNVISFPDKRTRSSPLGTHAQLEQSQQRAGRERPRH